MQFFSYLYTFKTFNYGKFAIIKSQAVFNKTTITFNSTLNFNLSNSRGYKTSGLSQADRLLELNKTAITQMKTLIAYQVRLIH